MSRVSLLQSCALATMVLAVSTAVQAADAAASSAASASSEASTVSEVIVTTQKRSEKLETVPVAVSAYTAENRTLMGIATMQDLTDYAPGLTYTSYDNRPYIRGVGRQTDNLAVSGGVATYVDGVYWGANAATILQPDTLFTDQIEVQRGPQNTLFGQNSDGGAIAYTSRKPSRHFEAEMRAGYANYERWFYEGAISGPINDHIRYRIGGNYTEMVGGYFHNLDGKAEGGNLPLGGNGHTGYITVQLAGDWGGNFTWNAKWEKREWRTSFHTEALVGDLPVQLGATSLFPNPLFGLCGLGYQAAGCTGNVDTLVPGSVKTLANTFVGNPANTNIRNFDNDYYSHANEGRDNIAMVNLNYKAPFFDVKYLFGYQSFLFQLKAPWITNQGIGGSIESYQLQGPSSPTAFCQAVFAANVAGCTQPLTVQTAQTTFTFDEDDQYYSHEVDFSSNQPGPLQWIAGFLYYHERFAQPVAVNDPFQTQVANPIGLLTLLGVPGAPAAPANPSNNVYSTNNHITNETFAVFGQFDWKITDTIKFTGGLRYTDDKKYGYESVRYVFFAPDAFGLGANTFGANAPAIDFTLAAAGPTSAGCTLVQNGVGACSYNAATGFMNRNLSASWKALTGTASLAFQPNPDTLIYLKYDRGFKSGGFNTSVSSTGIAVNPTTKAETVDAFEIGTKKVFGKTFVANLAAFYYDYHNDQQPLSQNNGNGIIGTAIANIPLVHSYGFEVETIWRPTDAITGSLNYSFLHATIASPGCFVDGNDTNALAPGAVTAGCTQVSGGVAQDVHGAFLPNSPEHKLSINGMYTWRLEPGNLTLSTTVTYRASQYDSVFNRPYYYAPAYAELNMRLTFKDAKDRYTVIVYANNLTNTVAYDGATLRAVNNAGTAFSELYSLTAPRTYGFEVQYRFR